MMWIRQIGGTLVDWFRRVSYGADGNPHTEPAQGLLRCLSIGVLLGLLGTLTWIQPTLHGPPARLGVLQVLLAVDLLLAVGLFVWMVTDRSPSAVRRALAMGNDYVVLCLLLSLGGQYTAPAYLFLLWTLVGSGVRYGARVIPAITISAVVAFGVASLANPYWRNQPGLAVTLLLVLVLVPVYAFVMQRSARSAHQQAQEALRDKTELLEGLSTELLTPLRGISALSEILLTRLTNADDRELAKLIATAVDEAMPFVSGSLDRIRGERGQYRPNEEDFHVPELVERIETIMRRAARHKDVRFRTRLDPDVPRTVRGDAVRLTEALICLLHNTLQQPQSGEVVLSVGWSSSDETRHELDFSIRDASGMSVNVARRRLLNLGPTDPADRGARSIAARLAMPLINQLRATCWIAPNADRGVCTTVRIRVLRAQSPTAEPAAASDTRFGASVLAHKSQVAPLRILLGEMDATTRWMIERILAEAGHHTAPARGSLSEPCRYRAGLLLVDLDARESDPLALIEQAARQGIPVVAIASRTSGMGEVPCEVLQTLDKPPDIYALLAAVEEVALMRVADGNADPQAHAANPSPDLAALVARVHLSVEDADPNATTHLATLMASLHHSARHQLREVADDFARMGAQAVRGERQRWLSRFHRRIEDIGEL